MAHFRDDAFGWVLVQAQSAEDGSPGMLDWLIATEFVTDATSHHERDECQPVAGLNSYGSRRISVAQQIMKRIEDAHEFSGYYGDVPPYALEFCSVY